MPTRLKDLRVDRVDLVDKGANPGAHVVLFKRDATVLKNGDTPMTTAQVLERDAAYQAWYDLRSAFLRSLDSIMQNAEREQQPALLMTAVQEFAARAQTLIPQLATEAAGMAKRLQTSQDPVQTARALLKEATMPPEVDIQELQKRHQAELDAAIAKTKEDAQAIFKSEIDKLKDDVQKAQEAAVVEKAEREKTLYLAKAKTYQYLPFDAGKDWEVFKAIHTLGPEMAARIETIFDAAEALGKRARLTESVGSGASRGAETATAKIMAMAKGLVVKSADAGGTLSFADALSRVAADNPDLYREYQQESAVRVG